MAVRLVSETMPILNGIESREDQSIAHLLLGPPSVPLRRNGYRVTGELSGSDELPNDILDNLR